MTSADITKLFWIMKKLIDDHGHYLQRSTRAHFHHALGGVLLIKEKIQVAEDARFYRTCGTCKSEVDLRLMGTYHYVDGTAVHNRCPNFKDDVLRDI